MAERVVEALTAIETEVGFTLIPVVGVVTITERVADLPATVAVIVADPLPIARTRPVESTVATATLLDVQVFTVVTALEGVNATVVWEVVFTVIAKLAGDNVMRDRGEATVMIDVAVCPFVVLAVIVAVPLALPRATPVLETVATDVFELVNWTVLLDALVGRTVAVRVVV